MVPYIQNTDGANAARPGSIFPDLPLIVLADARLLQEVSQQPLDGAGKLGRPFARWRLQCWERASAALVGASGERPPQPGRRCPRGRSSPRLWIGHVQDEGPGVEHLWAGAEPSELAAVRGRRMVEADADTSSRFRFLLAALVEAVRSTRVLRACM